MSIKNNFNYEWESYYFDLEIEEYEFEKFGHIPFSLSTYLDIYHHPDEWKVVLKPKKKAKYNSLLGKTIGKLIIISTFNQNPFTLPANVINYSSAKTVKIIANANDKDEIFCSGKKSCMIIAKKADLY